MNLQEFRQLSAGHALHALSPDDEHAFTRALVAHPEWQDIVDEDLETAAELGDAAPDAGPPSALRGTLLDLIKTTPQVTSSDPGLLATTTPEPHELPPVVNATDNAPLDQPARSGRRRTMWAGAFALAASLALFTTVALGTQLFDSAEPNNPAVAALTQVTQASDAQALTVDVSGGGEATLHWSRDLDSAVLVAESLPKLSSDRDFEVWLVRDETPISIGVLDSSTDPRVLAGFHPGDVVALTVEQSGGSPNGLPTTDPIVAISTV